MAAILSLTLPIAFLAACGAGYSESIEVTAGADAAIKVSSEFEVRIPGSSISGTGRLSVVPVTQGELTGWTIQLAGAELIGDADLLLTRELKADEPPPVALFAEDPGDDLLIGGGVEAIGRDVFRLTTQHFSSWFFVSWHELLGNAGHVVDRWFGDRPGANVTCENTARVEELGYSATLSGSAAYKWCLGAEDDSALIRVGNPNSFPVRVEATANLVLTDPDEALVSLLPQLFSVLIDAPSQPGNSVFLLGGGDSYTFRLASTASQGLQVEPSGAGYLASALLFGIDTVSLVWAGGSRSAIATAMSAAKCGAGFATLTQTQVDEAGEAADYLKSSIGTVFDCLGETIKKLVGADGVAAVALAMGVAWLLAGIQTLVSGLSGTVESLFNPKGATVVVSLVGACEAPPLEANDAGIPIRGCIVDVERFGIPPLGSDTPPTHVYAAVDGGGDFDEAVNQLTALGWDIVYCSGPPDVVFCGGTLPDGHIVDLYYRPNGAEENPTDSNVLEYILSTL